MTVESPEKTLTQIIIFPCKLSYKNFKNSSGNEGVESFFIMLLPEGIHEERDNFDIRKYVGKSQIEKEQFVKYLQNLNGIKSFVLEDIIDIKFFCYDSNRIIEISLECCFFHYKEGLEKMFDFWNSIK